MKGAIIFATRTGSTQDVAEKIKEGVGQEIDIYNIKDDNKINLKTYDFVILGSYMRRQQADIDLVDFVLHNKDRLLEKKIFIFVLAAEEGEGYRREIRNSFPKQILEDVEVANIGAKLDPDSLNYVEKVMIKQMAQRQGKMISQIANFSQEKLNEFIQEINEKLDLEDEEEDDN